MLGLCDFGFRVLCLVPVVARNVRNSHQENATHQKIQNKKIEKEK